jgi:tetratricopeptide (TPR) repeat protein
VPPEGLPEYEPLTPELVEDEAIRGDFMLRWGAILLAVLLGWTEVTDTLTLVRLRTGEYLAAHGWLPPAHDVFSSTATDRAWVNLSWLSDLVIWGAYRLGNDAALSILAAVLAGVAFWCVQAAARQIVSTWWGSVCAVLAVVAAFPLLRPGPDSITVLGLAVTMYVLARSEERPETRLFWSLPVIFLFWSNLDGHVFVGLALLAAYALGRSIGDAESESGPEPLRLWGMVGACLVASLLHPFHWHVLEAPLVAYGTEYPELYGYAARDSLFRNLWIPLTEQDYWQQLDVFSVAGLFMSGFALLTMFLNRGRLRWSHALAWLVLNGLAAAAGRQLAAVSVVNAVLAALNGQDWYRASFRQTYSVETAELVFSRGGRAVTVLAFAALGYLAISGRLMGADGRRVGFGFDDDLASIIRSYEEVEQDAYSERAFNFRLDQGDVLIWIRQKPFIDSRISLYARGGPDLSRVHQDLRRALQNPAAPDPGTGASGAWQAELEKYEITHALPRLSGDAPDYATFYGLWSDPGGRWALTRMGSCTASFYYRRPQDEALAEYLKTHVGTDFMALAFRAPHLPATDADIAAEPVWPREVTQYDRLIMLPDRDIPNDIQLARHYDGVRLRLEAASAPNYDLMAALAVLAVRHARLGLAVDPNSVDGYRTLASAYNFLYHLEQLMRQGGSATSVELRVQQLLSALYAVLTCDPGDAMAHYNVFQVLLAIGKVDVALEHLLEVERLTGALSPLSPDDVNFQRQVDEARELIDGYSSQVDALREELQSQLVASDAPRIAVVRAAMQRGLPGEALRMLEQDQPLIAEDPAAQLIYGELLLTAGRGEEALSILEGMGHMMQTAADREPAFAARWRNLTALANVSAGDYDRARDLWSDDSRQSNLLRLRSILGTNPDPGRSFVSSTVPFTHGPTEATEFQPVYRAQVMADLLLTYPAQWSMTQLNRALCCFEQGQTEEARILLQQLLRYEPESEFRPVVAFYLNCATGERVPVEGPSQQIPVWGEMFAPDVPSASGTDATPAGASASGTGAAASADDDRAPDDRR